MSSPQGPNSGAVGEAHSAKTGVGVEAIKTWTMYERALGYALARARGACGLLPDSGHRDERSWR
jgi:hypothetical protein